MSPLCMRPPLATHLREYQVQNGMSGSPVAARQAPLYLAADCCLVYDNTRCSLRSVDVRTCLVQRTHSSYGDRTFAAAGPRLLKSLKVQLRKAHFIYGLFRGQLKRHLFGKHKHGAL